MRTLLALSTFGLVMAKATEGGSASNGGGKTKTAKEEVKPETAIVPAQPTALAVADNDELAEFAGQGFQNQDSSDYSIPFIGVLQTNSPQCTEDPDKYRAGMLLNTATNDSYKAVKGAKSQLDAGNGICFIPAFTTHAYMEYIPRDEGGGFVGEHALGSDVVKKAQADAGKTFGKLQVPREGAAGKFNELVETYTVYGVVVLDDGTSFGGAVSYKSTGIKSYKSWMTKAKMIQIELSDKRRIPAPLFSHRYRLTTFQDENKHGKFFNIAVEFDGPDAPSCRLRKADPLFQEAVNIMKLVEEGKVKVNRDEADKKTGGSAAAGTGAADAPF